MKKTVLSIQHLLAMFGATVLVPILTGFNPSVAIFCAGIGTLIFHFCTEGKVPVFLGSSFAFIPLILSVKEAFNGDLAYAQGGIMVAGLIYVILSFVIKSFNMANFLSSKEVLKKVFILLQSSLLPSIQSPDQPVSNNK